jgi:hypothetical protein
MQRKKDVPKVAIAKKQRRSDEELCNVRNAVPKVAWLIVALLRA